MKKREKNKKEDLVLPLGLRVSELRVSGLGGFRV